MNPWLLILLGWLAMSLVMLGLWILQRRIDNVGIVDVGWTAGVGALGVFFAAASFGGNPYRRLLVAAIVGIWAIRLAGHVLIRVLRSPEDGRYRDLKASWGAAAQRRLFFFFLFQAVGSVLFALPVLIAARSVQSLGTLDLIGSSIWLIAICGEAIADRQLASFRHDAANQGQVCQRGLWRYSRHPNYFFEWLQWWSYVALAANAPYGWLTLVGPLAMLYFILRVTGIPPTEAQALRSRGEKYREYQRTTSAFVPWPPRSSGARG